MTYEKEHDRFRSRLSTRLVPLAEISRQSADSTRTSNQQEGELNYYRLKPVGWRRS